MASQASKLIVFLAGVGVLVGFQAIAYGQDSRDSSSESYRSDGSRRHHHHSPLDEDVAPDEPQESRQQRYEQSQGYLRFLDSNGDGTIDESETSGPRRYLLERIAQRTGMELKFPMPVSKVRESLAKHFRVPPTVSTSTSSPFSGRYGGPGGPPGGWSGGPPGGGPGGPPGGGPGGPWRGPETGGNSAATSRKPDAKQAATPGVPGFGTDVKLAAVPGFGPSDAAGKPAPSTTTSTSRPSASSASTSSSSSSSSSSSGPAPAPASSGDQKVRSYAASLLKQYDTNKNGVLEREEWAQMSGDPKASDRNGDGVITLDELTARLLAYSQSRSGSRSGGSSDASAGAGQGGGMRFRTPAERLPAGLPDWFSVKDSNGDGQVSMAEYAHAWSDSAASEFARYDLNNDGLITPQECLRSAKK